MAKKKKKKAKETIVMIRLPDIETRNGVGTMTLQRGELGHMQQFSYKGLTLKGNIAETFQTALQALVSLESSPPPDFRTDEPKSVSDATDSSKVAESVSTDYGKTSDSDSNLPEKDDITAESDQNAPESIEKVPVSTQTAITDTDDTLPHTREEKVSVSVVSEPTDSQQIALF